MKLKRTLILANCVVALGLLLGLSAAQAESTVTVDGVTATHIQNLEVNGHLYNVAFLIDTANTIYGTDLVYDFPDRDLARNAKDAVNVALNIDGRATKVGPSSAEGIIDYGIGYPEVLQPFKNNVHNGSYTQRFGWIDSDFDFWDVADAHMYADFTLAGSEPDEFTIGGTVNLLIGGGLVLQNNVADDLPIDSNGDFTFDTPLATGDPYNVTVLTQPEGQTCEVENGSGEVSDVDVTNVVVSCADG